MINFKLQINLNFQYSTTKISFIIVILKTVIYSTFLKDIIPADAN